MDERRQLDNPITIRRKPKPNQCGTKRQRRRFSSEAVKLGEVMGKLLEGQISPRQARFGAIAEAWCELLPVELQRHCRIADVSGGQLKVVADSPSYANKLRWCSSELLEELQQRCRRARIEKIKIAVG